MRRRIATLFLILAFVLTVVGVQTVKAQTTVNSNSVHVRNSAPEDVWFTFPGTTNVSTIQFGCTGNPINANRVFVTEIVDGRPVSYPFTVTVNCTVDDDGDTVSLANDIAVVTPDHTITIKAQPTNWTVAYTFKTGWYATVGQAQIVVQ